MGRNPKSHQQVSSSSHANDLLNFRFSTPAVSRQDSSGGRNPRSSSRGGTGNRNYGNHNRRSSSNNDNNERSQNYGRNSHNSRRTAQDRASARRKADSSMFYLHSSAEHSFLLTRRSPSKVHREWYSFNGVDESISWDSVQMVEQRVALKPYHNKAVAAATPTVAEDESPTCPVCLCDFVCARITKCGHSFCLPCILRHVQTYTANNPYHHVKCPCCGIPVVVDDLRPVSFSMVLPPVVQKKFRLRKLHRHKNSAAPFLPLPDAPMHCNPHFAPTASIDADAKYSRFQFFDPDSFHSSLVENQVQLQREISTSLDNTEKMYLSMALEIVLTQQQRAHEEHEEEESLRDRFANPTAGMYQPQSPALIFYAGEGDTSACSQSVHSTIQEEISAQDEVRHGNMPASVETHPQSPLRGRYRGDSFGSYRSVESGTTVISTHSEEDSLIPVSPGGSRPHSFRKKHPRIPPHGSMYLEESNAVHFYQSEDGQLVFLNGFNMACLLSDYTKGPQSATEDAVGGNGPSTTVRPPLPDFIEGRVLEIENVHLTPEVRKRMPFLSHIPLYTDVTLVELDLNHVLSEETRERFKGDIAKRRKRRQSKVQAEKRADKAALREEIEQINQRKARLQIIDPNDDFFQMPSLLAEPEPPEGEEFGPALGAESETSHSLVMPQANAGADPAISFSDALRRGQDPITLSSAEAFPALGSSVESFPSLGRSTAPPSVVKPSTNQSGFPNPTPPTGKKKKKKNQQVVLFSTGGARGF